MTAPQEGPSFEELSHDVLANDRVQEMAHYVQHGTTTTLDHVVDVARISLRTVRALRLHVDERALVRGALLHDFFLYDWHDHAHAPDRWHGFTHPGHALRNAEATFPDLTDVERDVIAHHMFPFHPVPPHTREGWVVCVSDTACSLREFFARFRSA